MKNINSIHLRKQGKRAVCHKIPENEKHLTDYIEGVSCKTCLAMGIKRGLVPKKKSNFRHIELI